MAFTFRIIIWVLYLNPILFVLFFANRNFSHGKVINKTIDLIPYATDRIAGLLTIIEMTQVIT